MKKLMIATLLLAVLGTSAFAADPTKISYKVTDNFAGTFTGAKNVRWSQLPAYTKATFELNDQTVEAYYTPDGESLGTSRKMDFKQLPLNAITKIKKAYAAYSVKEVMEFDNDGDKKYFVSLTDGHKSQILEVSLYGSVSQFRIGK